MRTLRWTVGDATVLRIGEVDASAALDGLLLDLDPAAVDAMPWLRPDFADPAGRLRGGVQAFLILVDGHRILVDPGIGENKRREVVPSWTNLHTDFIAQLVAAGTQPETSTSSSRLICTLTTSGGRPDSSTAGGSRPFRPRVKRSARVNPSTWPRRRRLNCPISMPASPTPSVPLRNSGLVELVANDHEVVPGVRFVPSLGHTPYHVSVLLGSGTSRALITGDVVHHPCQLAYPEWGAASDVEPVRARAPREELLARCTDTDTLVIGSHFPDPVAGFIRRDGAGVRLDAATTDDRAR